MTINDPKIFADAYDMTVKVFNYTKSMPKCFRPTLGRRLEEVCLSMVHGLRLAIYSPTQKTSFAKSKVDSKRINHLRHVSDHLDEVRLNFKLCYDLKIMNVGFYKDLSAHSREVGRELGGLIKKETASETLSK